MLKKHFVFLISFVTLIIVIILISNMAGANGNSDYYAETEWEKGHGSEIGFYGKKIKVEDIDCDGAQEIIFGNNDGFIHILQYLNETYIDEWKSDYLGDTISGIEIGDVDNDDIPEFAVSAWMLVPQNGGYKYQSHFYIFGYNNGTYELEWHTEELNISPLAIADIDNDGKLDITGAGSGRLFSLSYNNTTYEIMWEVEVDVNIQRLAVADLNNDGILEIVCNAWDYNGYYFYVFGYNGSGYQLEWAYYDIDSSHLGLAVGDVDDDNLTETLVGTRDGYVYIFGWDEGTYKLEKKSPYLGGCHAFGLEAGDFDNDNITEFVCSITAETVVMGEIGEGYIGMYGWNGTTYVLEWCSENLGDFPDGVDVDDVDDDGCLEIIAGNMAGVIYIFGYNGTSYEVEWKNDPSLSGAVAIGDVDGDSVPEIVVGGNYGYIYTLDGVTHEIKWKSPILGFGELGAYICKIAISDVNNNGINEIIATTCDGYLYIFGSSYEQEYLSEDLGTYLHGLALGDVDNDGVVEIIISNYEGYISVFGYNNVTYELEWTSDYLDKYAYGLEVGDVDNDNISEIIVGTHNYIFILAYNNTILSYDLEWQSEHKIDDFYLRDIWGLAVGDVDYDNVQEIVAFRTFGYILIFGYNGSGYELEWKSENLGYGWDGGVEVGDIDNDGKLEIVVGFGHIFVFSYNNTTYELEWKSEWLGVDAGELDWIAIGDIDADNQTEIVIGCTGYFYIVGINQQPIPLLSATTVVCVNESLVFNASNSFDIDGNISEYFFDFGDGNNSGWVPSPIITHSYSTVGVYNISLIVKDSKGLVCDNKMTISVVVHRRPIIEHVDNLIGIEDQLFEFSVNASDPDGDNITFYDNTDLFDINSTTGLISFIPTNEDVGVYNITIIVIDARGAESYVNFTLTVQNVNDKPTIDTYYPTVENPVINETENITFSIIASDIDTGDILSYKWYVNGTLKGTTTLYNFTSDYESSGIYNVTVIVSDTELTVSHTWVLTVLNKNRLPNIIISSPENNSVFFTSDSIQFDCSNSFDPDNDNLTFLWLSNLSGVIGNKSKLDITLQVGVHLITLYVNDTYTEASAQITITVNEITGVTDWVSEEEPLYESVYFISGILLFIVTILVGVILLRKRKT